MKEHMSTFKTKKHQSYPLRTLHEAARLAAVYQPKVRYLAAFDDALFLPFPVEVKTNLILALQRMNRSQG